MEIKQITDINKALDILWEHDQANQKINFPRDKPNFGLFKKNILKSYGEQPNGFLFIYEGEKIIGSMILRIKFNYYRQQKYGEVWYIYLDASCRGKGYGTKSLEYADKYFNENKTDKKAEKLHINRGLSWLWAGRHNCKRILIGPFESGADRKNHF